MEGPSLYLAKEQLRPFRKQLVLAVSGNTKIDKECLVGKQIKDLFSWGKHLVFQFDSFAIRIHFLLFGTFAATVEGRSVTGDYARKVRTPRLALTFENGTIEMYNCSIKVFEERALKRSYDFTIDIMSSKWDAAQAYKNARSCADEHIADVLLDQTIFAGVGNIIKNEILSINRVSPKTKVGDLSPAKLKTIVAEALSFSHQFYKWRKKFVLRANLKAHRKKFCPHCETKLLREKTGKRQRWSYWCPLCQPEIAKQHLSRSRAKIKNS